MTNKITKVLLWSAISVLSASVLAQAQEQPHLGEIVVTGSAAGQSVPGEVSVDAPNMQRYRRETVGDALNMLPGVHLSKVGARNEQMVYVRGHDLRQVPVFMDGVPVYVPYDGYVDLARFTTFDLARIDVAKGFSSMAYGPNAMGGAINLISRRPDQGLSGRAGASSQLDRSGRTNGHRVTASVNWASEHFYIQSGISELDNSAFRLPSEFEPTTAEDGGQRENAWNEDRRLHVRLGYTPNATDEYVLTAARQEGRKGNPPYAGSVSGVALRYWQWPFWDKDSLYLLGRTQFGRHSLTNRVYHDTYQNGLYSYDDASYTSQTRPFAFRSYYDDYSTGVSSVLESTITDQLSTRVSLHWKDDVHREANAGEPWSTNRDITTSLSFEGSYQWAPSLSVIAGMSTDRRRTLTAERQGAGGILDMPRDNSRSNNYQLAVRYAVSDTGVVSASVASRSRFATIKDRYSFRFGRATPNPALKPERALHSEIAYEWRSSNLMAQVSLFSSDTEDMIQSVSIDPNLCGSPPCSQMQNIHRVVSQGAEVAATIDLGSWSLGANWTFLDRENRSDPGILPIDSPRLNGFAWLRWRAGERLEVNASVQASSARVNSSDGRQQVAGTAVTDVSIAYQLPDSWRISAGVHNLTDRLYAYTEGFPEAGRQFYGSIDWSF